MLQCREGGYSFVSEWWVLWMDLPLKLRAGISEASFCRDWKFQNLYDVTFV